jgi:type II secretory pathway pseudopilin PulG
MTMARRSLASSAQSAFTSIELLVVISILAFLAGATAIGVVDALRRSRAVQGIADLREISEQAAALARTRMAVAGSWYGVRIDGSSNPNTVALTWGSVAAPQVLQTRRLNGNLQWWSGSTPLSSTLSWQVQAGSGYPYNASTGTVTAVGVATPLSLRTGDQRIRRAIAIYEIGVLHAEPF